MNDEERKQTTLAAVILAIATIGVLLATCDYGLASDDSKPVFEITDSGDVKEVLRISPIKSREETEWRTVNRKYPSCNLVGCAVMHYITCDQEATKYEVKYIEITYKGETLQHRLERTEKKIKGHLRRNIPCDNGIFNPLFEDNTLTW